MQSRPQPWAPTDRRACETVAVMTRQLRTRRDTRPISDAAGERRRHRRGTPAQAHAPNPGRRALVPRRDRRAAGAAGAEVGAGDQGRHWPSPWRAAGRAPTSSIATAGCLPAILPSIRSMPIRSSILDLDEAIEKLVATLPGLDEAELRKSLADRSRRFAWVARGLESAPGPERARSRPAGPRLPHRAQARLSAGRSRRPPPRHRQHRQQGAGRHRAPAR